MEPLICYQKYANLATTYIDPLSRILLAISSTKIYFNNNIAAAGITQAPNFIHSS